MANIDINLGQATLSAFNTRTPDVGNVSMADSVDLFFQASYNFDTSHAYYTNAVFSGDGLRLDFTDGAYSQYSGVTLANPYATSGAATATSLESNQPSAYRLTVGGNMNYYYSVNANGSFILQNTGGTINDVAIQTQLPTSSPDYDALLGNVAVKLHGAVTISQAGNVSGGISSLTTSADKLVASSTLTGNFNINGNLADIGQNLSSVGLSGIADSFVEKYKDGSSVSITNLALAVTGDTVFNEKLLLDGANLPSDDVINVTLAGSLATPWLIAAGAGNDTVTLKGGGATLSVNAGSGNDRIMLGDSGHNVDGGAGIDTTVFSGAKSAYTVAKTSIGHSVQAGGGTDTLIGVERINFADNTGLALDTAGVAGQLYRLYDAMFGRLPDDVGMGFWLYRMDNGQTLLSVAKGFINNPEFVRTYGENASDAVFVTSLYHNVLHREPDAGGYAVQLKALTNGMSREQLLVNFSDSAENIEVVSHIIPVGVSYTPWIA